MKYINKFLKILILIIFAIIIIDISFYVYAYITPKFPIYTNNNITYYDINGNDMFNSNNNDYVKLDEISPDVINAIVSIEDKNFYKHNGFDFLRIAKAMVINITSGKIKQGASTISQQYVKNLYLTFDKTWKRKIKEAFLTIELETHYSKEEILEGYLNTINFGAGCYGIKNASNYYFNKEPKDLTIEEATLLVGIPKSPTYFNPITNYDNSKSRQYDVIYSMYKNNYISKNDIDKIYNKELNFYGKKEKHELSSIYYYRDSVLKEMSNISETPDTLLDLKKIKIYTNFNSDVQKTLENNIDEETKNTKMQIASTVIDPQTGKVLALIGGKDYSISQYNRVSSAKRQVGSTIKPFLYYSALENGFTPSSTFLSERTTFNIGSELYSPKNANNVYANKNISMVSAIAYSDNIYALKTHLFLGEDNLSKMIERVKIKTPVKNNASAALGTTEINMLDYANGFITLANEGKHESPHLIERIEDANGNIIYEYKYENEYVLNKKYVYILNNLLTSTYNYSLVNYASPTLVSISNKLDSKYAVKSGSTATDYWTVGYNKDVLILVWAGNDDNSKVKSSESRITKYIWANTITNLDVNKKEWYDIPKGVTSSVIDPISGDVSAKGFVCYYEKGTEPNYVYNNIFDPN
mgnify:FL=1